MSILTKVLGIDQVWDGDDFVSIKVERLDAPKSEIWQDLARRDFGIQHQKSIRCFTPTHAVEVPYNILYLAEGEVNGKEVLFIAPEEGWATKVVTCHESFKGIVEGEYGHARHMKDFFRLQKLAGEF